MRKNKFMWGVLFLMGLFVIGIVHASPYTLSNPKYVSGQPYSSFQDNELTSFNTEMCQQGTDFLVQIAPMGCTPAVVRSDLLEEQDVPIFCELQAIKINPLINVEAIDSINFAGEYPREVVTVGFQPSYSALGENRKLNNLMWDNIGSAVIVLRQQPNESLMQDLVSGNLTAKIRYDVDNAFGLRRQTFYLPVMSDHDFDNKLGQYAFFNKMGFLRAEDVSSNSASIAIYSARYENWFGASSAGEIERQKLTQFNLNKGETSPEIFLPGFDCLSTVKFNLNNVEIADTRAKLSINSEIIEVKEGEKFLDEKCYVKDLEKKGLVQKVSLYCNRDDGGKSFDLRINPSLKLKIGEKTEDYVVGDRLYQAEDGNSVYLAYAWVSDESDSVDDLKAYVVKIPGDGKNSLSDSILDAAEMISTGLTDNPGKNVVDIGLGYASAFRVTYAYLIGGEVFTALSYSSPKDVGGTTIEILGFGGKSNYPLDESKEAYSEAIEQYDAVINSYSGDKYPENEIVSIGEKALYGKIKLAEFLHQNEDLVFYCDEFLTNYEKTNYDISICFNAKKLANTELSSEDVLIDGNYKRISFERIYEPSIDEQGVELVVKDENGMIEVYPMRKNQVISLNENESVKLLQVKDEESAEFQFILETKTVLERGKELLVPSSSKLKKDVPNSFGSEFVFTLKKVNLERMAKVSVIPNVNYVGSEAEFTFNVGIEKRDFQLSPEKTQSLIDKMNKTVTQWEKISSTLGDVVETMKYACFATGAALTVKNLIAGSEGKTIARGEVMSGSRGWYEECADSEFNGEIYISEEDCIFDNADAIDEEVNQIVNEMNRQNLEIKKIQEPHTTPHLLGQDVVNTTAFVEDYSGNARDSLNWLGDKVENPSGDGEIDLTDLKSNLNLAGWKDQIYSIDQIKQIELYSNLAKENGDNEVYKKRLYEALDAVRVNSENKVKSESLKQAVVKDGLNVGVPRIYSGKDSRVEVYDGDVAPINFGSVPENSPIQPIIYKNELYYVTLKDSTKGYYIDKVYLDDKTEANSQISILIKNNYDIFEEYDSSTYENKYLNPQVKYYEVDPYKGTPSLVPIDMKKGWYAYIEQTIPTGGNIRAYDDSGKVNSFWLGNVGPNGLVEFGISGADDTYQMINLGTGQPYNQFAGLSESETKRLVDSAVKAIWEASRQYGAGIKKVRILNRDIEVGSPATNIPGIKCTDYMSPKDCNILFNVCDPVICPTSRCDFGGAYPVEDVVQSGIIGSIALCLPNAKEGIYVPVCLTGVKAGIDGYLSVIKSYRDCLEHNLQTGETIGICDEIHSIYLCEFFWRQTLPLAKLAIPKILGVITGQNTRGGGEYYAIQAAWENARDSVSYFTQFYSVNAFKAFKARSTEEVGGEVCNSFVSAVYPTSGGVLELLTESDSPPQYTGNFDQIPFTTSTYPPISQYKVFYHIYAGNDRGAYYKVYLRGGSGSSYYQGTDFGRLVDSGYISKGGYATETVDFTAPEGYKEMCIVVNNEEQCGFKQVSTNFAVDYVRDQYIDNQATQQDIKTESECISGTPNVYSLLSLNIQEGVGDLIDPAIYEQGLIRICATDNPGSVSDPYYNQEGQRWLDVGYCGEENVRCWIDSESIKEAVTFAYTANQSIKELEGDVDEFLKESEYLLKKEFPVEVEKILAETDHKKRIDAINKILDLVYFNNQKGYLFLLRANAFGEIAKGLFKEGEGKRVSDVGGICPVPEVIDECSKLENDREKVMCTLQKLEGTSASRDNFNSCWDSMDYVYQKAGVEHTCVYSDESGSKYALSSGSVQVLNSNTANFQVASNPVRDCSYNKELNGFTTYELKVENLEEGDLISYVYGIYAGHNVIFVKWVDEENFKAQLFDWNGRDSEGNLVFRYFEETLSDTEHPVYMYWEPFGKAVPSAGKDETDSKTEFTNILSSFESENYHSPDFKLKLEKMSSFWTSSYLYCFNYYAGWSWSEECSLDISDKNLNEDYLIKKSVFNFPNPLTSSKSDDFVLNLGKLGYLEGLNHLLEGVDSGEISWIQNSEKDSAIYLGGGIFVIDKIEGVEKIYILFKNDRWFWSFEKLKSSEEGWMDISKFEDKFVSISSFERALKAFRIENIGSGTSIEFPKKYRSLFVVLNSLEKEKSFQRGAALILDKNSWEKEISIKQEISTQESSSSERDFGIDEWTINLAYEKWINLIQPKKECDIECTQFIDELCSQGVFYPGECVDVKYDLDYLKRLILAKKAKENALSEGPLDEKMKTMEFQDQISSWKNIRTFSEVESDLFKDVQSCSECGNKFGNLCDLEECHAIAINLRKDCVYYDQSWPLSGTCVEKN